MAGVIEVTDFEVIKERKEAGETRSSVFARIDIVVTVLFTLAMLLSALMVLGVLAAITLDAAGIVSLPSQLNVIPIKPMALWMGAAGLAWIPKLVYQRLPETPRLVQGIWAAAAVTFVMLSLICGYGFLKENWQVFFPWKPVSIQYEFTEVDSIKPLLDENGEFQIGVDGTMMTTPPAACPTGSEPIQVGKLPESDLLSKSLQILPEKYHGLTNTDMRYICQCSGRMGRSS